MPVILISHGTMSEFRCKTFEITAEIGDDGIRLIGPCLEDSELETVVEIARAIPDTDHLRCTPGCAHRFETGSGFKTAARSLFGCRLSPNGHRPESNTKEGAHDE